MSIEQQIPSLSDEALQNLHTNAVRLAQSGTAKQREQAEELLQRIGAALQERQASQRLKVEKKRADAAHKKASVARATRTHEEN